jgi:ubiquinone/menaquinone biosynthesis C-methylase UbiE
MAEQDRGVAYWDEYDVEGIGVGGYTDTQLLQSLVKGAVLEIGCGRGGKIATLDGITRRCGIDYSERAITEARKAFPGAEFEVADACALPYPDMSFDVAYSIEVIEHVEDYERFLTEALRVLKPGGVLFVQTPNYPIKRVYDLVHFLRGKRKSVADDYSHVSKFSYRRLARAVGRYFDVEIVETRNILGENALPLLRRLRESRSVLDLVLRQKTIVVARKRSLGA